MSGMAHNMKTDISKLTFFASLMLSMAVLAVTPSAVLKVKGRMGVASYTLMTPNNTVYDMGLLLAAKIKSGSSTDYKVNSNGIFTPVASFYLVDGFYNGCSKPFRWRRLAKRIVLTLLMRRHSQTAL